MSEHEQNIPRFNIPNVERIRTRLMRLSMRPRVGDLIEGDALESLAASVHRTLPPGITRDTVYESVRYLAGTRLTPREGMTLAWRLAGNIQRLKSGRSIGPWLTQENPEWVPLQVLHGMPFRNQRNKYGFQFKFRVLAGTPCPMTLTAFWSNDMIRVLATRMGFSRFHSGPYPFHNAIEFVGLRLAAELDPLRSRYTPTFFNVGVPGSFVKWNRDNVLKIRCRVEPCPREFIHPCRQCAVGYVNCPAGTHRRDYVHQFCMICGEPKWFDLDRSEDRCMDCHKKEVMRKIE